MGRCGRERAPCESVVAYRRWCLSQVHGGQASTHGCCGRLALSIPRTPDVSHRHPGKPRLIPSTCPSRFGAVEMDGLEPVGMRFEERLPTRRVECDALDVAAAPLVDNRHSASFVVAF